MSPHCNILCSALGNISAESHNADPHCIVLSSLIGLWLHPVAVLWRPSQLPLLASLGQARRATSRVLHTIPPCLLAGCPLIPATRPPLRPPPLLFFGHAHPTVVAWRAGACWSCESGFWVRARCCPPPASCTTPWVRCTSSAGPRTAATACCRWRGIRSRSISSWMWRPSGLSPCA